MSKLILGKNKKNIFGGCLLKFFYTQTSKDGRASQTRGLGGGGIFFKAKLVNWGCKVNFQSKTVGLIYFVQRSGCICSHHALPSQAE